MRARSLRAAFARLRAKRLDRLAGRELDPDRRADLCDRALMWGNREHLLLGLLSPMSYAASRRVLRGAIKRRKARRKERERFLKAVLR